jgi:hypothetical protein
MAVHPVHLDAVILLRQFREHRKVAPSSSESSKITHSHSG